LFQRKDEPELPPYRCRLRASRNSGMDRELPAAIEENRCARRWTTPTSGDGFRRHEEQAWENTMSSTIAAQGGDNGMDRSAEMEVVSRLAVVIRNTKLDCKCKSRLDDALIRFVAFERRRVVRKHLVDARTQRERIEALLVFLKELDDVDPAEPDQSVYAEMAVLFEDIVNAARQGAELMRQLSPPLSA
jgi:hypothetical protein